MMVWCFDITRTWWWRSVAGSESYTHTHTDTDTHTPTQIHTHACTHACMHTHTRQAHIKTQMFSNWPPLLIDYTNIQCCHTCSYMPHKQNTMTQLCEQKAGYYKYIFPYVNLTPPPPHVHTHTHTYTHTHTHTHTHTNTHLQDKLHHTM